MSNWSKVMSPVVVAFLFTVAGCSEGEQRPTTAATATNTPSEITDGSEAVGSDAASRYEGKIVRQPPTTGGKEDGWYLVKDGTRRWISDGTWMEKNGYPLDSVIEISAEEFSGIPEDPQPVN